MMTIRPRRSVLFLPASNPKAIANARGLAADVVVIDLEDSVAPDHKAEARANAVTALHEGGFGDREVVVRVNAFGTEWAEADLAAVAVAGPDAVLVPKVCSVEDVRAYDAGLALAPPQTRLWIMVETCALVPRLGEVAALVGSTRLAALAMGTNDLAKEMRAQLRPGRAPFLPILTATVCAARANGLLAFDGVSNEFKDMDVVRADCEQGLEFGFDGKCLIHPDQVQPCNAAFTPSGAELAWAQAVVDAFALPENKGKGAIRVDGKMTEFLHLDQAQRLLAIAAATSA